MAEQTQVETFVAKYVRSKTNRRGESTVVSSDTAQLNARIAVLCCRDENNRPIFTDDDIPSLIGCPQIVMSRILDAYKRLNQISDEDIEELEKNSEETPISNCGITLPSESGER